MTTGVDPHHDGLMLKTAMDVMEGRVLFRDTFCQYGALTPLFHAGVLWVFGPSLLALKAATIVGYGITAGLVLSAWRSVVPVWLALVAVVLWVLCAPFLNPHSLVLPWSSAMALAMQAASMLALCRAVETANTGRWAFASGLLAIATVLARTPVGVTHTVALGAGWLYLVLVHPEPRRMGRGLLSFAGGLAAACGLFFAWLARSGAIGAWYVQTIDYPRRWAASQVSDVDGLLRHLVPTHEIGFRLEVLARHHGVPAPSYLAAGILVAGFLAAVACARAGGRWIVAMFLCLAGAGAGVFAMDHVLLTTTAGVAILGPLTLLVMTACLGTVTLARRRTDATTALGVVLAAIALSAWHQYLPRSDPDHVFWSLGPMAGGFVWALWRAVRGRGWLVATLVGSLTAPLVVARVIDVREKAALDLAAVTGIPSLSRLWMPTADAVAMQRAHAAIGRVLLSRPNITGVALGSDALMLTFLPNSQNASPYFVHWPILPKRPASEEKRILTLERPLVFFDWQQAEAANAIVRERHYRIIDESRFGIVLAPRELAAWGTERSGSTSRAEKLGRAAARGRRRPSPPGP